MPPLLPADARVQELMAISVIACLIATFWHNPSHQYGLTFSGVAYGLAITLPIIPMLSAARRRPETAVAWRFMALAVVLNTAADLVYVVHDARLSPTPVAAPSDILYLLSCGSFIVGVVLLTQVNLGQVRASVRLDGIIAGFATASFASFLWFGPLLAASGGEVQALVQMAYPMFDLVMLVLLVAALAPYRYRPNWSTGLLIAGVLSFVVGDIIHVNQVVSRSAVTTTFSDLTFVVGIWLMGLAASSRDDRVLSTRRSLAAASPSVAAVPVGAGLLSIAVIGARWVWNRPAEVGLLALAALALVLVRMWMTLREERRLVLTSNEDARTDALTGLPNRRYLFERAEVMLAHDISVGVILIDLDGFKEVNDALGHGAGDVLLGIVGSRFVECLGDRGSIARLGGDEFAVVCAGSEETLVEIAGELLMTTSEPCVLQGLHVRLGASMGIAMSLAVGGDPFELLRGADVAMYEAKKNKLGVSVYRETADTNSRASLSLLNDLRNAIENDELCLYFQPTIDVPSGRVHGVEALARWNHPVHGMIQPDEFIPMAEHAGLISQLTGTVIAKAVAEGARLERAGHSLNVSVNISRQDLVNDELPGFIEGVLERHRFPAERLTIEITESSLDEDPERAARCVASIREKGVRISIDDFGVGYSSLSQLLSIAIDELKVDRSFMQGLDHDPRAQAIVRSAIQLGRALGLKVVAEGIESGQVLAVLNGYGVDVGQGAYISHPLHSAQLDRFLDSSRFSNVEELHSPLLLGR